MKHIRSDRRFAAPVKRAVSLLLAAAMAVPFGVFAPKARAAKVTPPSSSTINLVEWDRIDDMQEIGTNANCADPNAKYSRVMIYQEKDGDNYFLNADGNDGTAEKDDKRYSTYDEEKIPHVSSFRTGLSEFKEWNGDFSGDHFITVGGVRTPYLQYSGYLQYKDNKFNYHSWRLWAADKNTDQRQDFTFMLVDDKEDLDLRRTSGGFSDPHSYYGWPDERIDCDGWIFAKVFVAASGGNVTFKQADHAIWHWDEDAGGWNESLDFDIKSGNLTAKAWQNGTDTGVENFKIFLGSEHKVGALTTNFVVQNDQITTLGNPVYYISKGVTLRVRSGGILSVSGTLLNDGCIVIEEGGLLVLNDGAKIMPFTKFDAACGGVKILGGNAVVGKNALLCGGGTNGLLISGGGVINYGVLAGEVMQITQPYSVENRTGGWVIAGHSPSRGTRVQLIQDSFAKKESDLSNPDGKFAKVEDVNSVYIIADNAVYKGGERLKCYGEKRLGTEEDPFLTIYVKDSVGSPDVKLFKARLSTVSLRMDGDNAVFTAGSSSITVEKQKIVSATVTKGYDEEKLFVDRSVGVSVRYFSQFSRRTEVLTVEFFNSALKSALPSG